MKFGKENYLIEKGKSIKAHFDIKNVSGNLVILQSEISARGVYLED